MDCRESLQCAGQCISEEPKISLGFALGPLDCRLHQGGIRVTGGKFSGRSKGIFLSDSEEAPQILPSVENKYCHHKFRTSPNAVLQSQNRRIVALSMACAWKAPVPILAFRGPSLPKFFFSPSGRGERGKMGTKPVCRCYFFWGGEKQKSQLIHIVLCLVRWIAFRINLPQKPMSPAGFDDQEAVSCGAKTLFSKVACKLAWHGLRHAPRHRLTPFGCRGPM